MIRAKQSISVHEQYIKHLQNTVHKTVHQKARSERRPKPQHTTKYNFRTRTRTVRVSASVFTCCCLSRHTRFRLALVQLRCSVAPCRTRDSKSARACINTLEHAICLPRASDSRICFAASLIGSPPDHVPHGFLVCAHLMVEEVPLVLTHALTCTLSGHCPYGTWRTHARSFERHKIDSCELCAEHDSAE